MQGVPPAPPTFTPPTTCAKDSSCFDANYVCEGCCAQNKAKNGLACWDAVYTADRCCAVSGAFIYIFIYISICILFMTHSFIGCLTFFSFIY